MVFVLASIVVVHTYLTRLEESMSDTASPRRSVGIQSNLALRPSVRNGPEAKLLDSSSLIVDRSEFVPKARFQSSAGNTGDFTYTRSDVEYVGTCSRGE